MFLWEEEENKEENEQSEEVYNARKVNCDFNWNKSFILSTSGEHSLQLEESRPNESNEFKLNTQVWNLIWCSTGTSASFSCLKIYIFLIEMNCK